MKVVHVGFPKTATTFLQMCVFPRLPNRYRTLLGRDCADLFLPLIDFDDSIYDVTEIMAALEAALQGASHWLVSYEPLTGAHYRLAFVNRTQIARRLRGLGFQRVIITIRNQFDALESTYREYVRHGGVLRFEEYVQFDVRKKAYLYPSYFDYAAIYRLYCELFGRENVLVLQHEQLKTPAFLQQLCSFLEVEPFAVDVSRTENRSMSHRKIGILRRLNHVAYSDYLPSHLISRRFSSSLLHKYLSALPILNGPGRCMNRGDRCRIADFYRISNRTLEQQAEITLAPQYPGAAASMD